jgi:hypothetical protein
METRKILTILVLRSEPLRRVALVLALGLLLCGVNVSEAEPMGTTFTYQGRLIDADEAADGEYDFEFTLYDADTDGNQIGWAASMADVHVVDGYFTVELFLGSASFDGDARWLEIGVRPADLEDPNVYTILSPRQEVTPAPYAIYARMAGPDNDWMVSDSNMYSIPAGNVGIGTSGPGAKLEVTQDSWTNILKVGLLSSPNRLILSSGHVWASISGGATNRDDIGIQHSTGNVGIGTSGPDAKLEVDGDLKVMGAYKGNISSSSGSDGAPFPRPAYDSGWVAVAQNSQVTLTHNIGGNADNYVVDLQFKADPDYLPYGVNNFGYGVYHNDAGDMGAFYRSLTTTSVKVYRAAVDLTAAEVRVRIWVYN